MKVLMLVLGLFMTTAANAAEFTLVGDSVDAAMIRTVDTGYGLGRIFGYGLDGPFVVAEGTSDQRQYSSAFILNVDGGRFDIQFLYTAGWQEGTLLRISDLDFSPSSAGSLTSLTVDTNLVGYGLTVGPDFIDIALGGTQFTARTYFVGTFNVSAVPEPSTYALFALGLVGLVLATRRSKLAQAI